MLYRTLQQLQEPAVATLFLMKAVVITRLGGPEVLEAGDVPEPTAEDREPVAETHHGRQRRISRHAQTSSGGWT